LELLSETGIEKLPNPTNQQRPGAAPLRRLVRTKRAPPIKINELNAKFNHDLFNQQLF
jgi:hypothetical protein